MEDTFIRELELELNSTKILKLHQKIEGDVSCVVWDASLILAKYLETLYHNNVDYFKDLNIIELGSGVGCVGLTAACLGANVTLTDLPEALPLLNLNVETNKVCWETSHGSVNAFSLDWGHEIEYKDAPDMILLADCVYYKESIYPLIKTLKELARSDTNILLCQELRESEKQIECWKFFIKNLEEFFNIQEIPIKEQHHEYSSPDVVIMKLKKL